VNEDGRGLFPVTVMGNKTLPEQSEVRVHILIILKVPVPCGGVGGVTVVLPSGQVCDCQYIQKDGRLARSCME
jgi:hypothetical protein